MHPTTALTSQSETMLVFVFPILEISLSQLLCALKLKDVAVERFITEARKEEKKGRNKGTTTTMKEKRKEDKKGRKEAKKRKYKRNV